MPKGFAISLNGQVVNAQPNESVLEVAKRKGINIPTLCYLEGLSVYGSCRLCLVEVEGSHKLQPACATQVFEDMHIQTHTDRLQNYRRMIIEMLFAEGNHVCSVCAVNGNCELQDLAVETGMDHVRLNYQYPKYDIDATHEQFLLDPNRCVLCTRCVRTCDEIEGAHTWDVAGRGSGAHVIIDMNQNWGSSTSCTSCSKCVQSCPTGALVFKGSSVAEMKHKRGVVDFLNTARTQHEWSPKEES